MKYFEPTYLIFLAANIVNWVLNAKDLASGIAALILTVLTCIYMYHKGQNMKISNELKREELKKLKDESNDNKNS